MGGGGGGDSSAVREAEAQAAQEKAARKAAIERLNRLFGIGQDEALVAPNRENFYTTTAAGPAAAGRNPFMVGAQAPSSGGGARKFDQAAWDKAMKEYNARRSQGSQVAKNRSALQAIYDRIRGNTSAFYQQQLDEQQGDASRRMRDELARRGQAGSSIELDQFGELQKLYDRGALQVANRAEQAALDARSRDEQARLNAVRDINADVNADSAIQGALSQTKLNAEQAAAQAQGQTLGDMFARLSYLYDQRRAGQGATDAQRQFRASTQLYNQGGNRGTVNRY